MRWPPPRTDELLGALVCLRPISEADREGLRAAGADPEIWRWVDRTIGADGSAFDRWFDARLAANDARREWTFATARTRGGEPIGSSSYLNVRPEHDGLEIGWTWLDPAEWRAGANVEAKLLMLTYAFEVLGCMRVEFKTDARNERSRGALAALPATFEGIFRKHMLVPGVGVRDSAYFSITDDEWHAVKTNLELRLSKLTGVEMGTEIADAQA